MSEREPTTEEVDQVEVPAKGEPVPVVVEGSVRTQRVPAPIGTMRNWTVNATEAQRIAKRDLRRRRLVVYSADQPIFLGTNQEEALTGTGFLLRDHEPLSIEHSEEVWAICSATGMTTIVSAMGEQWVE